MKKTWRVSEEDAGSNPSIYIEEDGYGTIATVGGGSLDVRRANARILAASLEMLSALKEMIDHSYVGDSMRLDLARSNAKRIVAKVEGTT